jgi:hypothetical protein
VPIVSRFSHGIEPVWPRGLAESDRRGRNPTGRRRAFQAPATLRGRPFGLRRAARDRRRLCPEKGAKIRAQPFDVAPPPSGRPRRSRSRNSRCAAALRSPSPVAVAACTDEPELIHVVIRTHTGRFYQVRSKWNAAGRSPRSEVVPFSIPRTKADFFDLGRLGAGGRRQPSPADSTLAPPWSAKVLH